MSSAQMGPWAVTSRTGSPDSPTLRAVLALAEQAQAADANPPLSEQTLLTLKRPAPAAPPLLLLAHTADGTTLAGVAVVVPDADGGPGGVLELVVDPTQRGQGVATALLTELAGTRGLAGLAAWSHGGHPAAVVLAARHDFAAVRELWRMRLAGAALVPVAPAPAPPSGITVRPFIPGQDEDAWLAANAAAFAHHPEQGGLTVADLRARMAEPWFDPAGFFLAVDAAGSLLGFHWTKVHPATADSAALGEVYVVGVTPQAQGLSLGKVLTRVGLDHLRGRGLGAIILYVDADNTAAVALYRSLGFTTWDTDVMYAPARAA